ncbi:hypothetical protein [Acinetobacter brisouii]|uniref:hypothetical protein n=1 Tax=Acinetobacter brisouii TaxID=396323 RepID=UPI0012509847|nr:hypothetical protein [Acinetobacter brisouii]
MSKAIYSFKANGGGCRVSGRVIAVDMQDATNQVKDIISGYGSMNVNVSMLANQERAMKEWQTKHGATQ